MKTVEEIVKEKRYYELTAEERLLVSDMAQNEEEYDQLRHLLMGSATFFESRKVVAGDGMREHIMEKLYPPSAKSVAWYESLWFFLFPPSKRFYQYPALQLATVFVLFLGIFTILKNPLQKDSIVQNNAVENTQEQSPKKEFNTNGTEEEKSETLPNADVKPIDDKQLLDNEHKLLRDEMIDERVSEVQMEDMAEPNYSIENDLNDLSLDTKTAPKAAPLYTPTNTSVNGLDKERLQTESSSQLDIMVTEEAAEVEQYNIVRESNVATAIESKSSKKISTELFRGKSAQSSLSVTAIKGLADLFFEVK